jgi:carbamoyl-phosphate synthase small subunit
VLKTDITGPASWRATRHFDRWLMARGIVGVAGVDTRALTALIRERGMPNGVVAHRPDGDFDEAECGRIALDERPRSRSRRHHRPAF